MYWTTLGWAQAPCKIPEICEMQICIDVPVLLNSIWKLISTSLFVYLFDIMDFFQFLSFFSTFFRKKLEEIPFFKFLPFFPEETYFFRKFLSPVHRYTREIPEPAPFLPRHGAQIGGIQVFPTIKIIVIHQVHIYCCLSVKINARETPHGAQRSWTNFVCVCFRMCGRTGRQKPKYPQFEPHG